jgi:hypothetical protein
MARVWGDRRREHVDPEPFMIRTSVGVREFKICTLCACLVLAEQRGHFEGEFRHLQHHAVTNTLGEGPPTSTE